MKKAITSLFAILIVALSPSHAQLNYNISGKVVLKDNSPGEFVNVVLLNPADSSLVRGTITNSNGEFDMDHAVAGNYLLRFSQLGYETAQIPVDLSKSQMNVNTGTIKLKDNVTLLQSVEVVAKKPFIEQQTDKMVVNVENSIVNAGSTAMEVLQKSPGVTIDNSDNISLKGKSGVVILIDGKNTHLSDGDLATMLKSLSSENVQKIELMTNPSAKYEAEGNAGIINIVMRKDKNMGANGSVSSSYGQGKRPDAGAGVNLNYRQHKTNVYASYNYDWRKSVEDLYIKRNFSENGIISSVFTQNSDIEYTGNTHRYKIGVDYYIDDFNTAGVLFRGMNHKNTNEGSNITEINNNTGLLLSDAVTLNNANESWDDYNLNLNWLHKFDTTGTNLSFDFDYALFENEGLQLFSSSEKDYLTNVIIYGKLKNYAPGSIDIKSGKADFEHSFTEDTKLEAGVKSSFVVTDNDVKYYNIYDELEEIDTTRTNRFKYSENINAAYASIHTKYKKIGMQVGLRAEQTIATGEQVTLDSTFKRKYIKLFPTLYLERSLNENNQLNFSFSRRYNRPSYQDLNPFRYYLDQYTYKQGNSLLEPQYSYNFELTHTYKSMYSVTFNYSITDDVITEITKQVDSTFTTYLTKENLNQLENIGLSLSIPIQFTKRWTSNNYFNVYYNHYQGIFEGGDLNNKSTTFNLYSSHSYLLPHNFAVELSGWYNSEQYYGIIKIDPMWSVSIGIEKKLFNEQASIKVIVNDIFYQSAFSGSTKYRNQNYEISSADDTRFVRVHFNYRFGKNTVQQARRRQTGAEEERERINRN